MEFGFTPHEKVSRLFAAATVTLIVLHLALCGALWMAPQTSLLIAPSEIRSDTGNAYYVVVQFGRSGVYHLPTDSPQTPSASNLTIFENGHALGPPHSAHIDIREKGAGRFSHWGNGVFFSTTDGSDPRSNGRAYSIQAAAELQPTLKVQLIISLLLADLTYLFFYEDFLSLIRKWGRASSVALAVLVVLLAAASASGLFGTIVVAKNGPPKDTALVVQILQHAFLGCVTSIGIWAAGAGVLRLVLGNRFSGLPDILIPAFPISLILLAALVALALVAPWGRSIAVIIWLACLLPLCSWRPPRRQVIAALKATLAILPFAIAFGAWLALLWHGPTDTLSAAPSGDLSFYAGNIWSFANQAYPNLDLGYANGEARAYFNNLYPALGATLLYLPNFDPFLFLLAGGGTSYVLLTALTLHLYATDRIARFIGSLDLVLLTLSIVVAARYPYWVAESIPMVFVPGLTISVWWMAQRNHKAILWTLAAMTAGLVGSLLSKVVTAAVLVPLGSTGAWSRLPSLARGAKLAVLMITGAFSIYSAIMLFRFLPMFIAIANPGPESYLTPNWYYIGRDAGATLMGATVWMFADVSTALVLSFGVATFLVFPFLFQANFVCVSILLGLLLISAGKLSIFTRTLAFTSFVLCLPALIWGDPAGASSGVIWIICLGGATLTALLGRPVDNVATAPQTSLGTIGSISAATLAVIVWGLLGVARGSIIADSGWHFVQSTPLTPALKEIWTAVRERTPLDALIFTDQVDESSNILGGWNTYAYSGQRQVYLSSYYTSADLRPNKLKLEQVLTVNKAVLEGMRPPQSVPTRRKYGSFYGVVSASKDAPSDWRLIFKNNQYALYDIAGQSSGLRKVSPTTP
ncbi:hypothetical protein AS156_31075 [Bradyrhizobium macuxiense]|uniref:Uncharacterized protein n=1 Tax=Bradyrhizobium macuxiense TaxID=1755647 RepID=A0A120FR34_9BRAD|nr:hypothetical protein [Bradyrhizobium macuxiense]KWV59479.1 hypothetical protein AS156_31075 [Bradyrhizobium macuxiense]